METIAHIAAVILIVVSAFVGLAFAFDKPKGSHAYLTGMTRKVWGMKHVGSISYAARYMSRDPWGGRHRPSYVATHAI